ncbi:PaaI family thioesterase [Rhodococcus oryzae]|uniref:PaaI family thioesterase n=1 Tax=Rhodococcus oryzae TaxID=2571143 RepID=UPI00379A7277
MADGDPEAIDSLTLLRGVNETAPFNRWAGFVVSAAGDGTAELRLPWRAELGQYSGFLHAAVVAGMIDTACGFAAATVIGQVLAAQCSVNFLSPAVGDEFVARAVVVKAGKRQVFTTAELFAERDGPSKLVATGTTILAVPA